MGEEVLFLFVNPKSGGNKGVDFLQVPNPFVVPLEDGRRATLHIYDLTEGSPGTPKRGFQELRKYTATAPIRMIVGGGDGTILWAISEAERHGVDVQSRCLIGIVPLGTGNDFSRQAGWGGKNPTNLLAGDCANLRAMVQNWCIGLPKPHDIWQVTVNVEHSSGEILRVGDEREETPLEETTLTKPMINYCSFGQDSKVGVGFDKRRTKSQFGNYLIYIFSCMSAEASCWAAQHVSGIISRLWRGRPMEGELILDNTDDAEGPDLVGNPEMMSVINVSSYAGGLCHLWQADSLAGTDPPSETVTMDSDPGDGRVEVVTVPNLSELSVDSALHRAKRVFSGAPLTVEFFQDDEVDLISYCQIDGEFYKVVNPTTATIVFAKRIRVLHNVRAQRTAFEKVQSSLEGH